jgi:hypothetical protein
MGHRAGAADCRWHHFVCEERRCYSLFQSEYSDINALLIVEEYLATKLPPDFDYLKPFSSLEWWKVNGNKFPRVAVLARRYLCVPATSTPSERLFSSAGETLSSKRSTLSNRMLRALVVIQDNPDLFSDFIKNVKANVIRLNLDC